MRRFVVAAAVAALLAGPSVAMAQTTPPSSAAAQPTLPETSGVAAGSPIVGGGGSAPLTVRKRAALARRAARRHVVRAPTRDRYDDLERPALAGVELVTAIPHPAQPPHAVVPTPAYPLENVITFYTAPPPPVVCRRVPRDPDAPDPNLIRERTVLCEADNP